MATVTSLTEAKIRELVSGWEGITLTQEEINILIQQLLQSQGSLDAVMAELRNILLPQLNAELDANSVLLSNLNDVTLPALEASLTESQQRIEDLRTVDIPAIQVDLANEVENTRVRPKVFVQPEPPPPYDDLEERDLVRGDTWFDSDDNNKHYMWNGVEWSSYAVDVADFSLTVRKFMTNTHMIY